MSKKRATVMIVDDNDMMRTVLRSILRGHEYDVVGEARNGIVAVEMAARLKPDVICLDVMMPEKNGIEALCEIKAAQPDVKIVMVTGNADPDTVQESIMNGAVGFIVKPFNAAKVLDTLDGVSAKLTRKR
ncbi:MAG: response regulator [Dechloromonas sp.]|nr:MAG: response regulator [Dechloromonas sp.]